MKYLMERHENWKTSLRGSEDGANEDSLREKTVLKSSGKL
ncbi:unnamed protein product [Nezara viridula]|uniref:Uncharacterized protein n=1 Tax=Nezara viridula TaxID=85310 RepID=A0A9P0HC77_NEZVI|nr:unnamed protein product [Nezara viridula]